MVAKRIDKEIIAERISIFDLVSQYVELTQAGKRYKGICPFHPDKNPSFFVNPDLNTFHCFGCGVGGDIYTFFMKFHDVTFPQALQELARRAGIKLESSKRPRNPAQQEARQRALALTQSVGKFYQKQLLEHLDAKNARDYLIKRGLDRETITRFSLGYAPQSWDGLLRYLSNDPASIQAATALGLLMPKKTGHGFYDRFRNRLIFPIMNTTSQILGFGGRTLDEDGPKYINSPESFLYQKGSVLYGLNFAQQAIWEKKKVILVEGYFDLITLHQFGFTHSVAVLGTVLTENQIDILKRYTREFLLIFDGDIAGKKASFRNLSDFIEKGIVARVIYLPDNEDPDSFLRNHGPESLQKQVDSAPALLDLYFKEKTQDIRKEDSIATKVTAIRTLLPVLRKIPDQLEQSFRIKKLADQIGIAELFLREEVSKHKKEKDRIKAYPPKKPYPEQTEKWPAAEKLICQILIQFPHLIPVLTESNVIGCFRSPELKAIIQALENDFQKQGGQRINLAHVFSKEADNNRIQLLSDLSCKEEFTVAEAATALNDGIRRVKETSIKGRLEGLNDRIKEAEKEQQVDLQSQLFLEMQRLLEEKKALFQQ